MIPEDLTCEQCREYLPWCSTGQLAVPEISAVERHLAGCAACRRELATWDAVADSLNEEDSRIPPDTRAGESWLNLREHLPLQSGNTPSPRESAHLAEYDTDLRIPARIAPVVHPPRRSGGRPVPPLLAVAAIIILSVVLFVVIGIPFRQGGVLPTTRSSSTATPTSCGASALSASIPSNAIINDLSMSSPRDGWAVGWIQEFNPYLPGTAVPKATLLLHFQNCRWQPIDESIPNAELLSVSMSSASDGWAVGVTAANRLLVLHYTGTKWQMVQLPGVRSDGIDSFGTKVRMTSSGEGWMLIDDGMTRNASDTTENAYTLLHFQGGAWAPVPVTFAPSGGPLLTDIAATNDGDCWVVGYGDDFAVAHYHNGVWKWWSDRQLGLGATYPMMYSVTHTSPSDVWVGGGYPVTTAGVNGIAPLVLHYDGTRWTHEKVGDYVQPHEYEHEILTIAAQSPNEVWAFTNAPTLPGATVTPTPQPYYPAAHYHDGVWSWIPLTDPLLFSVGLITSVDFVSGSEGYAVAAVSTQAGEATELVHFSNGRWSGIPSS